MVHSLLGKPVLWPSDEEFKQIGESEAQRLQKVDSPMAMHEGEDEDDEDVVLEWWAGAEIFGVGRKHTPVKRDADQLSPTTSHSSKEPSPKRVKQEGAGMSPERQDQAPPRPKKGRQIHTAPMHPRSRNGLKKR